MKRGGWALLTLGILLALGTGAVVFLLLQQQQRAMAAEARAIAAAESAPVATLQVPVAARPLTPGAVLTADDILLKPFPLDLVPLTAITSTVELESQVLVAPVGQGETFSRAKISGDGGGRLSQMLPPDHMLLAFPAEDLLGESNVIEDGDRIDLLLTLPVTLSGGPDIPVTAFTLQSIDVLRVLRAADPDSGEPPTALLLSVTSEEAVLIKHIKDSGGVIDFVLRSVLDESVVEVPPVDREDLIARYGLR